MPGANGVKNSPYKLVGYFRLSSVRSLILANGLAISLMQRSAGASNVSRETTLLNSSVIECCPDLSWDLRLSHAFPYFLQMVRDYTRTSSRKSLANLKTKIFSAKYNLCILNIDVAETGHDNIELAYGTYQHKSWEISKRSFFRYYSVIWT